MFDENLEVEWCSWKAENFAEILKNQRLDDYVNVSEETIRSESKIGHSPVSTMHKRTEVDDDIESSDHKSNLNFLRNPHSAATMNIGSDSSGFKCPIPRMKILILVVGTRYAKHSSNTLPTLSLTTHDLLPAFMMFTQFYR